MEKVLRETGKEEGVKRAKIPLSEAGIGQVTEAFKVDAEDLYRGKRKREVSRRRALVSGPGGPTKWATGFRRWGRS